MLDPTLLRYQKHYYFKRGKKASLTEFYGVLGYKKEQRRSCRLKEVFSCTYIMGGWPVMEALAEDQVFFGLVDAGGGFGVKGGCMLTLELFFLCIPPSWFALKALIINLVKVMSYWRCRLCFWSLKRSGFGIFQGDRALASLQCLGAAGAPWSRSVSIQWGLGCPDAFVPTWVPRCPLALS